MASIVLTVAGVFFLSIGIVEMGYGGLASAEPLFGAVFSPGILVVLFGIALLVIGRRRGRFSKHR
jgi:hypothetical protein